MPEKPKPTKRTELVPPERLSKTPSMRAMVTGKMTPAQRTKISQWLSGILNPDETAPASGLRTHQQRSSFGFAPDPTVNLALQMLGGQYPESTWRSPTLHVAPELDRTTAAARMRKSGHLLLNPAELPEETPTDYPGKFQMLLDTLRHEYSHGMGLGDWPIDEKTAGGVRTERPSAYDVGAASARLHEDIELPRDLPPAKKGRR